MYDRKIEKIAIVGGGTAGWMAASLLSKALKHLNLSIAIVEPTDIPTIGVGEATLPPLMELNNFLGFEEREFIQATNATHKLGIDFQDWRGIGEHFFHGFGDFGEKIGGLAPHHYWQKLRMSGLEFDYQNLSFPTMAGRAGKFVPPPSEERMRRIASYKYAYHFDAHAYARFLRKKALEQGVQLYQQKVVKVESGSVGITQVQLEGGATLEADFYLDCTGFQRLLIGDALRVPFLIETLYYFQSVKRGLELAYSASASNGQWICFFQRSFKR